MDNIAIPILSGLPEAAAVAAPKRRALAGDRVPALDGIRGIAVLLVMSFHLWIVGIAGGTRPWERIYGDVAGMEARTDIRFVEYPTFLDKDRAWVYNTSSLVVERAAFLEAGGWSEDIFFQDIQDLLNKLCVAGTTNIVLAPETVLYRMHSANAVRQVARFIEGIYVLLAKASQGAYPGGPAVAAKRSAWFGGLIFYWAKAGMRKGLVFEVLKLLFTHGWMVPLATIRRAFARSSGRRPVEVLPHPAGTPVGSHPAHPPAESILHK